MFFWGWQGLIGCRSELAREKLTGAAPIQKARVIVDAFREQARSYIPIAPARAASVFGPKRPNPRHTLRSSRPRLLTLRRPNSAQ
jgi:hypothetical protein